MIAEIAIGRKTGLSAIGAFRKISKKWSFVGYIAALVPALILPYYSVIGGWVIKYLTVFVSGHAGTAAQDGYFEGFIGNPAQSLLFFAIFMGITAIVVLFGVEKGVEKVSKIMMPVLAALSIGIAAFVCISNGVQGKWDGLLYYLKPDFANFSIMTVVAAMGQLFYSMSLAMGIMITYGSYMKKDVSLESATHQIEFFDMGIAFFAGLMIVPSVVSYSGIEGISKGPGLMFVTLPKVFNEMGPVVGSIVGGVFFILVFFAALTSSISLMETVVSILQDKFHLERRTTCLLVLCGALIIGVPSALGFGVWSGFAPLGMDILSFFDFLTNSVLMPIVAILTCIVVCYVMKPKAVVEEIASTGKFKLEKLFRVMIYIAPILLFVILAFAIFEAFGITFGGFLKF
jgi:NSS family neurotransmitter:Na+ symporter